MKSGQAISPNPLRQARSWLSKASKDKNWILLGILALGAYLRLWNIHHLFNVISDFDEGIYSLAARFISQGYLPYQDFTFVHPPLFPLTLASIYKIFGYNFFYGKYLSVVLSVASIALIYLVGRKMHHTGTGLAAAALFAVSTEMVYFGRRCVQESMGIFLILVAIYFAFDFINNGKNNRLFFCGLFLGLTLATKYLFVPAVAAIIIGIILISTGERFWRPIKTLGRASFWVVYLCTATIILAILLLLKYILKFDISIPFFNPLYFSVDDIAVSILIFAFPVIIALRMLAGRLPFKEWWLRLWGIRHSKTLWLLLGATALGFVVITGFFWIKTPQEFIYQTILIQQNRPHDFLSLVTIIQNFVMSPGFLKMSSLPIVMSIPLILVILNKRSFSWSDCFLSMALIVSLVLCQGFYHLPRYYASLLPFLLLGLASLMLPVDMQTLTASLQSVAFKIKAGFLILVAFFFLFLSISIILLTNYSGYDISDPWLASSEEYVYGETVDYLESAGAKKIYAVNPMFVATFPNLNSTMDFDTFALLWLEKKPPEEIITDMIDEGVDYVVIDPFLDWWTYPWNKQAQQLALAIRRNARLIRVIAPEPNSPCTAEIYLLGAEKQCSFNVQIDQWL